MENAIYVFPKEESAQAKQPRELAAAAEQRGMSCEVEFQHRLGLVATAGTKFEHDDVWLESAVTLYTIGTDKVLHPHTLLHRSLCEHWLRPLAASTRHK